jgi:hypothetical protein
VPHWPSDQEPPTTSGSAFGRVPSPWLAAVGGALHRYAAEGRVDGDALVTLCESARQARHEGIKPEALVIALRDVWHQQGGRPADETVLESDLARARLINLVLDAYFLDD